MNYVTHLEDILREIEKDSDNNTENLKLVISAIKISNNKIDFVCLYPSSTCNMIYHELISFSTYKLYDEQILEWKEHLVNDFQIINL